MDCNYYSHVFSYGMKICVITGNQTIKFGRTRITEDTSSNYLLPHWARRHAYLLDIPSSLISECLSHEWYCCGMNIIWSIDR